ncbi:MAG: hypothetical protein J6O23_03870 [Prevotella sp.]|nr:hypothetical protein [Prevotella sp.]
MELPIQLRLILIIILFVIHEEKTFQLSGIQRMSAYKLCGLRPFGDDRQYSIARNEHCIIVGGQRNVIV